MRSKVFLTLIYVLVVVVVSGVVFFLIRSSKPASLAPVENTKNIVETPQYPYFPENSMRFLDKEKTWGMSLFQPVYKDFQSVDMNTNYLIVSYVDATDGRIKEGKIFLGRQTPYIDEAGIKTFIGGANIEETIKRGEQFGVEYLSLIPEDFSTQTFCNTQPKPLPLECVLAALKQESDKKGENIFYVFRLFQELKQ